MSTAYHAKRFSLRSGRGRGHLNALRQRIIDVEDEIMAKRDGLIEKLEKRMRQRTHVEPLFTIR